MSRFKFTCKNGAHADNDTGNVRSKYRCQKLLRFCTENKGVDRQASGYVCFNFQLVVPMIMHQIKYSDTVTVPLNRINRETGFSAYEGKKGYNQENYTVLNLTHCGTVMPECTVSDRLLSVACVMLVNHSEFNRDLIQFRLAAEILLKLMEWTLSPDGVEK